MERICAVAYYRVSTKRQGKSGLGLQVQQDAVNSYQQRYGPDIVKEFFEAEGGKKDRRRPILQKALRYCRKHKTLLIIAKLDRLARDLRFVLNLIDSKVKFVVADKPHADRYELLRDAIEAEKEGAAISQRTRECLQAAKRRGVELGRNGKKLAKENKQAAEAFALFMAPTIRKMQAQGITTMRGIAAALNKNKIATYRHRKWHASTVHKLLSRIRAQGQHIS